MRTMIRHTTHESATPRGWRRGAFPVLCVLVAVAVLAGGSLLLAACGNTETGTLVGGLCIAETSFTDTTTGLTTSQKDVYVGVDLDSGEHVKASLTEETANKWGIANDMASDGKKVEVGKKGDSWEFVRLVEE